ncbi:MAG TPA: hypothetical protein VNJ47_03830 [Nevskiales bacterium]|nr:hypothetical protein [Nevskiales bacterium]
MRHLARVASLILVAGAVLLQTACSGVLPSKQTETRSPWTSFDQAKASYDLILPGETRLQDLQAMGLDPARAPNVRRLNYVELIEFFMPHPSIQRSDLDPSLRACLDARESCYAYEIQPGVTRERRHGNVALDVFGFRRETTTSGWQFKSLIVLQGDVVTYKLWSGEPNIQRETSEHRPLGPLQSGEKLLERAIY